VRHFVTIKVVRNSNDFVGELFAVVIEIAQLQRERWKIVSSIVNEPQFVREFFSSLFILLLNRLFTELK
jgi:hypothetical protein